MARQQIVQGGVHKRGHFAGLLEAHSNRRAKMHVDLAGLDTWKEILPEPGHDQNHRGKRRREEHDDESAAPRHRLRQQLPVAVAKAVESSLESRLESAEIALRLPPRPSGGDR